MATKDTPLDRQLRKAMDAIDAIVALEEVNESVRLRAIMRIVAHGQREWERQFVRIMETNEAVADE